MVFPEKRRLSGSWRKQRCIKMYPQDSAVTEYVRRILLHPRKIKKNRTGGERL